MNGPKIDLRIRAMAPAEIALAADWAAAEGWNPGLADAPCFATVDPQGFLIGELDGAPAATISNVNYSDDFAFLGFYIVRPDLRGRGYGLAIWRAAIAHAGRRVIGLDGVIAQQDNYRKSGFALAHRNIRFGGTVAAPASAPAGVRTARRYATRRDRSRRRHGLPGAADGILARLDRSARASGPRPPGAMAGSRPGGVIRPARHGFKIGPLVADDRGRARRQCSTRSSRMRAVAKSFSMCLSPTMVQSR